MFFKNGMQVRLIQPEIAGEVVGGLFIDGAPNYLVAYIDADGEPQQVYFRADRLEEVPAPAV